MAKAVGIMEARRPTSIGSAGAISNLETYGLFVDFDLDEDGRRIARVLLDYASYAGLQAEFEGDTGTTVLNAALDTAAGALSATAAENLPSSYAGFVTHTVAWSP